MAKHDSSSNQNMFSSSEHAFVCGQVGAALQMGKAHAGWISSSPDLTANEDYKPMFTIQTSSGKKFKVVVVEDF